MQRPPTPGPAGQFLPKTAKGLETAIKNNTELADAYAGSDAPKAAVWERHHRARASACRDKLDLGLNDAALA